MKPTEGEEVLESLRSLRRQIDKMEKRRPELYAQQKELYVDGFYAHLTPTEMAKAMRPRGNHEHLAETIRQHLKSEGLITPRSRRKTPAKR